MKSLSKMSKKELSKLSKDQIKTRAIKEIQELISKDKSFDGVVIDVSFKDKEHSNLRVFR